MAPHKSIWDPKPKVTNIKGTNEGYKPKVFENPKPRGCKTNSMDSLVLRQLLSGLQAPLSRPEDPKNGPAKVPQCSNGAPQP